MTDLPAITIRLTGTTGTAGAPAVPGAGEGAADGAFDAVLAGLMEPAADVETLGAPVVGPTAEVPVPEAEPASLPPTGKTLPVRLSRLAATVREAAIEPADVPPEAAVQADKTDTPTTPRGVVPRRNAGKPEPRHDVSPDAAAPGTASSAPDAAALQLLPAATVAPAIVPAAVAQSAPAPVETAPTAESDTPARPTTTAPAPTTTSRTPAIAVEDAPRTPRAIPTAGREATSAPRQGSPAPMRDAPRSRPAPSTTRSGAPGAAPIRTGSTQPQVRAAAGTVIELETAPAATVASPARARVEAPVADRLQRIARNEQSPSAPRARDVAPERASHAAAQPRIAVDQPELLPSGAAPEAGPAPTRSASNAEAPQVERAASPLPGAPEELATAPALAPRPAPVAPARFETAEPGSPAPGARTARPVPVAVDIPAPDRVAGAPATVARTVPTAEVPVPAIVDPARPERNAEEPATRRTAPTHLARTALPTPAEADVPQPERAADIAVQVARPALEPDAPATAAPARGVARDTSRDAEPLQVAHLAVTDASDAAPRVAAGEAMTQRVRPATGEAAARSIARPATAEPTDPISPAVALPQSAATTPVEAPRPVAATQPGTPVQAAAPATDGPRRIADAIVPQPAPAVTGAAPRAFTTRTATDAAPAPDAPRRTSPRGIEVPVRPTLPDAQPEAAGPTGRKAAPARDEAPAAPRDALATFPAGPAPRAILPTDSLAPAVATPAPQRIDFATLVDSIARARADAAAGASSDAAPIAVSVSHAEFGKVGLRIQAENDGLRVALSNSDPAFAGAVAVAAAGAASADTSGDSAQGRPEAQPAPRAEHRVDLAPQRDQPSAPADTQPRPFAPAADGSAAARAGTGQRHDSPSQQQPQNQHQAHSQRVAQQPRGETPPRLVRPGATRGGIFA